MSGYVCHVNENIPGAVYIGRKYRKRGYIFSDSALRNPFAIKDTRGFKANRSVRLEVIAEFRVYASERILIGDAQFIDALIEARDKPLACWCRKSTAHAPACHGDVILELLDTYTDDQLRNFMKENA